MGVCSPCGSIDAKPSGFGISADSALGVMELMIGGGGMRNLPIIEESSDNAQPTNDDVSVSVEISDVKQIPQEAWPQITQRTQRNGA